jgi:hypothetical protein
VLPHLFFLPSQSDCLHKHSQQQGSTLRWGVSGLKMWTDQGEAIWPDVRPLGVYLDSPPLIHHLMGIKHSSSFFKLHSRPACCMLRTLICMGDFMVMGRTPPQSHQHINNDAPKSVPECAETPLLLWPLHF